MTHEQLKKLMEIQYLKGRLDELYKGYVAGSSTTDSRMVDYRISKYENKLKDLDEVVFHLHQVERTNVRMAKQKSKNKIKLLLQEILPNIESERLIERIEKQLNNYN